MLKKYLVKHEKNNTPIKTSVQSPESDNMIQTYLEQLHIRSKEQISQEQAEKNFNGMFDQLFKTPEQYESYMKKYTSDGIGASIFPTTSPNACLLPDQIKDELTITPIHHSSFCKSNKRPSQLGFFTQQSNANEKSKDQIEEKSDTSSFCTLS